MKKIFFLLNVCLFSTGMMHAEDCAYEDLEGQKSDALLASLHNMIVDHTVLSYSEVRGDKSRVDIREDGTIWDMYSDCTFYPSSYCGSGTDYEACDCYNREHGLPKSWWGGSNTEPMYTDLHHIFPTDFEANSQRGAWAYGEVTRTPVWNNSIGSKVGYGTFGSSGNNYVFEPADEYKGDIARVYFYMVTCYNDKNFTQGGKGYQMFTYSGGKAAFTDKALSLLLKWHRQDPVSEKELTRDAKINAKQHNTNPYVHEPALIEFIWGNKKGQAYACPVNEAVENVPSNKVPCTKVLRDGHLYLLYDGVMYDVQGRRVN